MFMSSPPFWLQKKTQMEMDKLHIAIFPWLAFGHLIPDLDLAKLIAKKGHKISFISTPKNIDRLPKLPPDLAASITFVKLTLPRIDKLPENAEATSDLTYDKIPYLKKAYDLLEISIREFLDTSKPDWIFYDVLAHWMPNVAREARVSHGVLSIFIAAALAQFTPPGFEETRLKAEDFMVPPQWVPFPSKVVFKLFEINRIFDSAVEVEDGQVSDVMRIATALEGCDIIAIRSCREFEPEWLGLLQDLYNKPVIPVGELPTIKDDDEEESETWLGIKAWLDNQQKGSVVYIAFGSEAKPSQTELTEIALGLELSGLPFFWVLKTQRGSSDTELISLPEGFEERTKGRGVVFTTWAPQFKILSHDSIGGFLTHSGWSSVVQAIQCEKALVLLTSSADQGWNSRVLEEKNMAFSIPRDDRDGSFTRESVADSLKLVLKEDEGKIYRDKVREMNGIFGDMSKQDRYVENFLHHLATHKGMHHKQK